MERKKKKSKWFDLLQVFTIFEQIVLALLALSKLNLVNGDLKASNILVKGKSFKVNINQFKVCCFEPRYHLSQEWDQYADIKQVNSVSI